MPEGSLVRHRPPNRSGLWRYGLVLGGWVMFVGGGQLYAWQAGLTPLELAHNLGMLCEESVVGPLLFMGAALLSPLLLLPAALLGGVAGICFGPALGIVYTLIGCNLSALLVYSLGRLSGQGGDRVARLCARYGARLHKQPLLSIVLLRLSFLPYDPINYLVGVLRVRPWPFVLANTLGSLPGVVAIVLTGNALSRFEHGQPALHSAVLLVVAVLVLLSVALALLLRRRAEHSL
jgi:uncharacterized membrane protein YdjX (TVP38/TMEM64 family)